jgi:hypothetical protein
MFVEELLELAKGVQQVVLVPDQRAELRGYGVLPGIMQVDAWGTPRGAVCVVGSTVALNRVGAAVRSFGRGRRAPQTSALPAGRRRRVRSVRVGGPA